MLISKSQSISTHDLAKRSTQFQASEFHSTEHFNSRPREEVDSTATVCPCTVVHISTHDLAKRSTKSQILWVHCQVFQLTTSRRGRQQLCYSGSAAGDYFNSRPREEVDGLPIIECPEASRLFQLTTSRRGRLLPLRAGFHNLVFQLTTSRRGRRSAAVWQLQRKAFQLTTSRRGRQLDFVPARPEVNFNSRPREEVDISQGDC